MWFLPVPSYPVYLLTNFKSNSDLASFRFATNIKNSLLNVLTELQRPQSTKYRFQKFATDSNNFKRAPNMQTLARIKCSEAWPRTQISRKPLNQGLPNCCNSLLSLNTLTFQIGPAVPNYWVSCLINISDYKAFGKAILLESRC